MSQPQNEVEIMLRRAAIEAEIEAQTDKEVSALNSAPKHGKAKANRSHGKSALPVGGSGSDKYHTLRLQAA
jgi:hypothetical protein